MNVKDIMNTHVVRIAPNASLQQAALMMKSHDVGMLPVVEDDRVVGVITDRDIVVRGVIRADGRPLPLARAIMTEKIVWCFEDSAVETAARRMIRERVHRLLIFSRDMRLKGVVSFDDIAVALRNERLVGQLLRDIASPLVAYRTTA